MRVPEYLSPSSLKTFYSNRDQYYKMYICDEKSPRDPQTTPMSVGSAFDAYVKSYLSEKFLGKRPEFEFQTLFEAQVEPHNRDRALVDGKSCYDQYRQLGALADVMLDMEGCIGPPRFETDIVGFVSGTVGSVPFRGKPDIFFLSRTGARVIFDWKVNGFYAARGHSPKAGYVRIRTNDKHNGSFHRECFLATHEGIRISASHPLETVDPDWAAQLSVYAWLLGEPVGGKYIVAIDQLACKMEYDQSRSIRVAQHRALVTQEFQEKVFKVASIAWQAIKTGHIFFELTREESDQRCAMLDISITRPVDTEFQEMFR